MSSKSLKSLTVTYPAGERIVRAGELGACLFVIQAGRVRLSRRAKDAASCLEIGVLEKGDVFGESALLEGHPYAFDAEAETDCEVVEMSSSAFRKMLSSHPELAVRVMGKLASRLERLEGQLLDTARIPSGLAGDAVGSREAPSEVPQSAPQPKRPPARLELEDGDSVFALEADEVVVGRHDPVTDTTPDVDLTGLDNRRSVSRRHARLVFRDGHWGVIEEAGVLNGTFVNADKVSADEPHPVTEGDVLAFGAVRFRFRQG
ncbi:MAG: cyclic nucleotide-binding domain-containing protein [Acidobacteriota bacterium]|nr:MAG: cyclic nucleotide-binding domain-containing protein [Acidobacteriota bacterium]